MDLEENYFSNTDIPEDERRNNAFQLVNGVREIITLARNSTVQVRYELAYEHIYDLNPNLYNAVISLLTAKNESEIIKLYKERAEAKQAQGIEVGPIDLIDEDIIQTERDIDSLGGNKPSLLKHKVVLIAAKEYFTPRSQSEHKSLNHDFYLRSRNDLFGVPVHEETSFRDYKMSKNKFLRLRLLHPDREEAVLGVDLIYERYDTERGVVRFAHMQYKSWDNKNLYPSQSNNLVSQMARMKQNICDSGYCNGPSHTTRAGYRFPYCSAFLRPTSRIQRPDSKHITTGVHLPICQANYLFERENKISKENCKERSLNGKLFEELFISNSAGSRWIPIEELKRFYEERNILSHENLIRLHATEYDIRFDEEMQPD